MVGGLFEYLFIAAFIGPPAAVVAGIGLLLMPTRRRHRVGHRPHAVNA